MNDSHIQLQNEMGTKKQGDCGCGQQSFAAAGGELPPLDVMESALAQLVAVATGVGQELDLAFADALLDNGLEAPPSGREPLGLDELIALTERHPGLKLTLSFG